MKPRYLQDQVIRDLREKMVFIGGPRQVGKTTLAKSLLSDPSGYLNWDAPEHREKILRRQLPSVPLWVFDEFHKYRAWRNYLKGIFDLSGPAQKILVTGSARLDFYRFGGDSLQGRYHYLRLHPLSAAELGPPDQEQLMALLRLGGFPEPFFSGSETAAKRWSLEYRSRLIGEDLTSLEKIRDLGKLELLMLRLPELVSSPLSLHGLSEDIQVSHRILSYWVECLERLYAIFRLSPFGPPKVRAVKKAMKHYHFDWSLVPESGARFENLIACHLLKWTHFLRDTQGRDMDLRYYRDVLGREVDFVIMEGSHPTDLIECKWNDDSVNPALRYLKARLPQVNAWQISAVGSKDYISDGIRVLPARVFLRDLV